MPEKNLDKTMTFSIKGEQKLLAREIIEAVYSSLKVKGYNPISQLVGYFLSGDPAYITSYNNARNLIKKLERDELLEEIIKSYLGEE